MTIQERDEWTIKIEKMIDSIGLPEMLAIMRDICDERSAFLKMARHHDKHVSQWRSHARTLCNAKQSILDWHRIQGGSVGAIGELCEPVPHDITMRDTCDDIDGPIQLVCD